ncbi:HAD family hydrolase [Spirosoma utsteinense]|uniref:Beta-phosphoglucomutase family hydrolase n=1 Tax=Spirosoma utsteinense TaxID=2585773 RepID=A0ABR6W0R5_9BACT|nr:HAD family phosphatase [Spirosoma utsteinense]MBC3788117.1 beta-phosphoglucomutase family hydrolase [Spirosoma utsteinense]MBC3790022.1 beta-phosphoglucomutase family hydrolase [Spirosoma utsteinense]
MKAIIFDMDGVIVDTNPHHKTAWREYYERYGKTLSDDEFVEHISGKHNSHIVAHLFTDRTLTPEEVARLSHEKEALFRELYRSEIVAVAGLVDFLKALKAAGIRTAVATSAPVENLDFVMDALDIRQYFDVLLNESMVSHPKPDPEIYQKAMTLLGVEPADSVVFEDSMTGIQAGKASGATVVGVATTQTPDELWPFVDDVIHDFTEMTPDRLQRLINVF